MKPKSNQFQIHSQSQNSNVFPKSQPRPPIANKQNQQRGQNQRYQPQPPRSPALPATSLAQQQQQQQKLKQQQRFNATKPLSQRNLPPPPFRASFKQTPNQQHRQQQQQQQQQQQKKTQVFAKQTPFQIWKENEINTTLIKIRSYCQLLPYSLCFESNLLTIARRDLMKDCERLEHKSSGYTALLKLSRQIQEMKQFHLSTSDQAQKPQQNSKQKSQQQTSQCVFS